MQRKVSFKSMVTCSDYVGVDFLPRMITPNIWMLFFAEDLGSILIGTLGDYRKQEAHGPVIGDQTEGIVTSIVPLKFLTKRRCSHLVMILVLKSRLLRDYLTAVVSGTKSPT